MVLKVEVYQIGLADVFFIVKMSEEENLEGTFSSGHQLQRTPTFSLSPAFISY